MKRKLFSFLLALTMVLTLLPAPAFAATLSGDVPFNIYYSYNTDTKVLTLSGSGPLNDNSSSSYFKSWTDIPLGEVQKVVIKSGVTELGNYAFKDFYGMTSITIPDTVTRIGKYAFDYCYSLTSITLPKNLKNIEDYTFYDCFGLASITIPSRVTAVGTAAFNGCDALRSVTFQGAITEIGERAFHGCSSLTTVTFSSRAGSSARIEQQAFSECSSLGSIAIPEGVYAIADSAFRDCSALRSVTFPSSLLYIDSSAFHGCSQLSSVSIPKGVLDIGTMAFYDCTNLQSVTFNGDAPSIGRTAFLDVTATAYYPAGNDTWTTDVMQNYGGTITWVPVCMGSHSYGAWTQVDESKHKRTCTYCSYEETADHSWDEGSVTLAPTCQATGEALHTCTGCGATKTEVLPLADHSYSPWETVDDQTHTHACTVCSKEETVGHSWDEGTTLKAANCIADGEMKYTCTGCGLTRNETVPMTGIHTYDHGCDTDCNICDATRTTQHKYSSDWTSNKSGHWHKCVHCGAKQTVLPHTPGPEPTEETPQTCTACGYILKPTLKHEHAYADTLTGDETGHWYPCECMDQKDFAQHDFDNDCDTKCDACGYERVTQHVWSTEWSHDEAGHFYTCTVCGEQQDGSQSQHDFRRGVCKVCAAEDPDYEPPTIPIVIGAAVCVAAAAAFFVWKGKKKKTAA